MPYNDTEREFKGIYNQIMADPSLTKENKDLIDRHVSYIQAKGLNQRTQAKHLYCIRRFYRCVDKDINFGKATKDDVQKALGKLESSKEYSTETKRNVKSIVKAFWKHMKGDDEYYPVEVRWIKTSESKNKKILPEDLLNEDEILKMIETASGMRNKAIISLLFDSGIRAGELLNMRKKDVDLVSNPAHIVVNGKTGARKIPILFSAPYLAQFLNTIKSKKNDDPLWTAIGSWKNTNRKADYSGIKKMLKQTALKAGIEKRIYPHLFRHSRASSYANRLNEQQLKAYFGWTGDSKMASTYVHLSGRDIDSAIMKANGVKVKDEISEVKLKPKLCPRCTYSNAIDNTYCARCGSALTIEEAIVAEDRMQEFMAKMFKTPKSRGELIRMVAKMDYEDKKRRGI